MNIVIRMWVPGALWALSVVNAKNRVADISPRGGEALP